MKILIVVDMQNDFVTGSLANQTALEVIPFIKSEIESGKYSRVLFTQDTHYDNYLETQEGKNLPVKHCIFGTKGWDVVDELKEYVTDTNSIQKTTFGFNGWNEIEEKRLLNFMTELNKKGVKFILFPIKQERPKWYLAIPDAWLIFFIHPFPTLSYS